MKRWVALILLPVMTGCGLLSNDRAEYYQAMTAREERLASQRQAAEQRLAAQQAAHEEQMSRVLASIGTITDPNVRAITAVALGGFLAQGNIATTALALAGGRNEPREQTIVPPETAGETLRGVAAALTPIVPWLGVYGIVSRLSHSGLGTQTFTSGGDMQIQGSLNHQQAFAFGDGAATTTLQPYEVRPEVVKPEVVVVEPTVVTQPAPVVVTP